MKQSSSGSKFNHSSEVVVNSKVIPMKQYATSLTDQSNQEGVTEPLSGKYPELGGDPGVRECPSGASSPGGTPNNTLGKSSKVSHHYDPLAASLSEGKLDMGGRTGGQNRVGHQPPQDGMDTQSDTNLLNYSPYTGGVAGGVAYGRVHVGGQVKAAQKPPHMSGVKGTIRNWENRGAKGDGDHVEGPLPSRVLHLPISSSVKDRGRGGGRGEQGVALNGYAAAGGKGTWGVSNCPAP